MDGIEKLGQKDQVSLRTAKDPRPEGFPNIHKGSYEDGYLAQSSPRQMVHTASVDPDLKKKMLKIPAVPVMCVSDQGYTNEPVQMVMKPLYSNSVFLYLCYFSLCVCTCVMGACRGQKRISDP